jgi:hypothetical protein
LYEFFNEVIPMPTTAQEIKWRHDFDAALAEAGDRLVLLDFSAAPM